MNPENYPHACNFLSCYYHQDWSCDYPTVEAAARAYAAENPVEHVRSTLAELRMLLHLEVLQSPEGYPLLALGCYYDPGYAGRTPAEWLGEVADLLDAALHE